MSHVFAKVDLFEIWKMKFVDVFMLYSILIIDSFEVNLIVEQWKWSGKDWYRYFLCIS